MKRLMQRMASRSVMPSLVRRVMYALVIGQHRWRVMATK
jgi:hypothetical protein